MANKASNNVLISLMVLFSIFQTVLGDCRDGWIKSHGRCYLFSREQASWAEAEAFCLSMNSNLVEIGSEAENAFIEGALRYIHGHVSHSNEVAYWLGGNDVEREGHFKWVKSNSHLVFADWNPGQPDNASSGENCIELHGSMNFHWNDLSCQYKLLFICEESADDNVAISVGNMVGKR